MEHPSEPLLPPELEHRIVEMAFDPNDPSTTKAMMLVAKRIYEWTRALLYSVFDQGTMNPFPNFALATTLGVEQIGKYARSILLGRAHRSVDELLKILRHCPNVRNLALWYNQPLRHIVPALRELQRLQVLSGDFDNIPPEELLQSPFNNLTHIEMLEPCADFPFDVLGSFIHLTHLSIYCFYPVKYGLKVLSSALDSCFQLIVCCLYSGSRSKPSTEICDLVRERDRIVFLDSSMSSTYDWISGAYGCFDCWQYAENVVIARKNKYFKPEVPYDECFSIDFDWHQNLTEKGAEWYSTRQTTRLRSGSTSDEAFTYSSMQLVV